MTKKFYIARLRHDLNDDDYEVHYDRPTDTLDNVTREAENDFPLAHPNDEIVIVDQDGSELARRPVSSPNWIYISS